MTHFGVSKEAAEKRIETRGKYNYNWRTSEEKLFDETILFKYANFMDSILPKKSQYVYYEDSYEKQKERETWMNESWNRY